MKLNTINSKDKIRWQPFFGQSKDLLHTRIVLDDYAVTTGEKWCSSNLLFCARGFSPTDAESALDKAMKGFFGRTQ